MAKTTLEIFGNRYVIQGEADPNYIRNLGEYVDAKMREISAHATNITTTRVAVMAALNIADELFKQTGGAPPETRGVDDERVETLIAKINHVLSKAV